MTVRRLRRAWWGVTLLFLIHGLVVASWLSRIPAVQTALHLNNGILGLALLSSAAGAVTIIPAAGYLTSRCGSRPVSVISSLAFCVSIVLPGLAVNAPTLAVCLFVYGAMAAAMDVSMNAQGVEVENQLGRPTMSRFHAMFSAGAMAGAGIGGWIASHDIAPLPQFAGTTLLGLAGVLASAPLLIPDQARATGLAHAHRLPLRQIPAVLWALSGIGFCILLSEGAMADWTAVYLRQVLHSGPGLAAIGYAVFSAAMAVFRFAGDAITARLGPMRSVRWGCVVAAVGLICALIAPSGLWSLPGFAAAGAGLSVIIPLVFGSGGRVPNVSPGPGIATVTGFGYIGFIVGPPAIGFASHAVTLRYALGLVCLCCVLAAWLAGYMRLLAPVSERAASSAS